MKALKEAGKIAILGGALALLYRIVRRIERNSILAAILLRGGYGK